MGWDEGAALSGQIMSVLEAVLDFEFHGIAMESRSLHQDMDEDLIRCHQIQA